MQCASRHVGAMFGISNVPLLSIRAVDEGMELFGLPSGPELQLGSAQVRLRVGPGSAGPPSARVLSGPVLFR